MVDTGIQEELNNCLRQLSVDQQRKVLHFARTLTTPTDTNQTAADDPVEKFIGAFSSNIPDWADQHDKYIG